MNNKYDALVQDLHDFLKGGFSRATADQNTASSAETLGATGPTIAGMPDKDIPAALQTLSQEVSQCTKCILSEKRTQAVFGVGVVSPLVMVIGEGPGEKEDREGLPFVGASGQYLDKWLAAIGLSRTSNVYITNVVKCHPPSNRNPSEHESKVCSHYLYQQIALLQPKTILILGRVAGKVLLEKDIYMKADHGTKHTVRNITAFITYHPSAVLHNPSLRAVVWEDLKAFKKLLT